MAKRLLSVTEAAEYIGLSPRTLYNLIAPGSDRERPVKPKVHGRKVLFDIKDLDRFADELPYKGNGSPKE